MQTPCDEKTKTPQSGLEKGEDPPTTPPLLAPNHLDNAQARKYFRSSAK